MSLGKNKAKIYMQDEVGVRFDDVAGVDESKQELKEVIEFLKEPGRFTEIGGRMPAAFCSSDRRAPARPCSPRPWPAKAGCPSSA